MRIAIQLTPELLAASGGVVGVDDTDVFGDAKYAVITAINPTNFLFQLLNEDQIVEAAKADADMQIVSL